MAKKKSKVPLMLASITFITLIFAIPFVNRLEPMIWGMPFLLWWIVVNVTLTPVWLGLAYLYEQREKAAAAGPQGKRGAAE